jgi:hypothetical protein
MGPRHLLSFAAEANVGEIQRSLGNLPEAEQHLSAAIASGKSFWMRAIPI